MKIFISKLKCKKKIIFILIPIIVLILIICLKKYVFYILPYFPKCQFNELFDLYCPACGNTRCILALLNGDILSALKYNLTPVIIIFLLFLLYIEKLFYVFNKPIQILTRNYLVWTFVIIFMMLYYILRNIIDFMNL